MQVIDFHSSITMLTIFVEFTYVKPFILNKALSLFFSHYGFSICIMILNRIEMGV